MFPLGVINQSAGTSVAEFQSTVGNLSNGNQTFTATGGGWARVRVDRPKSSGKWFFAVEIAHIAIYGGTNFAIGTSGAAMASGSGAYIPGAPCELRATYPSVGKKWIDNAISNYGVALSTGDIVGIGYDADSGEVTGYLYSGGIWVSEGVIATIAAGSVRRPIIDANTQISGPSVFTLRHDLAPPAGYGNWLT